MAIRPARKLTGEDVLEVVQKAAREHGAPDHLRSDNGSEFITHVVQDWFREHGIKTIYIAPGNPRQNGRIESFHAPLHECLNRELLLNLRGTGRHRSSPWVDLSSSMGQVQSLIRLLRVQPVYAGTVFESSI